MNKIAILCLMIATVNWGASAQEQPVNIHIVELGIAFGGRYYDESTGPNGNKSHNETVKALSLFYTYGWQLSQRFFAGIGSGYKHLNVGPDYKEEIVVIDGISYEKRVDVPVPSYDLIPIFGQTRFYFRKKPESAYLSASLGSFFKLDQHEGKPRLYWELGLGQRYKLSSTKSITWSLNFNEFYLFRKKQGFNEPNENPRIALMDLRIGIQF